MQKDVTKKIKLAPRLIAAVGVAFVGLVVLFFAINSQKDLTKIKLGDAVVYVEIAISSQEKQKGLCCRASLPEKHGMLFVYNSEGNYRFWMKDTRFPLDMFWINSEKKIVHIEENVQPSSFPKQFGSNTEAQYVLETNSGFARTNNVQIGDTADFEN